MITFPTPFQDLYYLFFFYLITKACILYYKVKVINSYLRVSPNIENSCKETHQNINSGYYVCHNFCILVIFLVNTQEINNFCNLFNSIVL